MLPSVTPKLAQCKSTFDMHTFRVHHNCKIDTARFEEGKRHPIVATCAPNSRVMRGHIAHCWIKRGEEVLMWSDDGKPSHPWLVRPHAVSVKVNGKVRVLDRHTR
jgi:hypothetical protein